MRARKLVLNIAAFLACLAFAAGCGPSFKSGRDKSPNEKTQAPAPVSAPSENLEVAPEEVATPEESVDTAPTSTQVPGAEAGPSITAGQPLRIDGESKLLADKLVIGVSLEKIGPNHKLTAVLKDKVEDQKPRVELSATLSTATPNGSVGADKIEFAQIGNPPFVQIDEAQYSVDYRCLAADCATIEVDLQRLTGDKAGFRVSMEFETKENVFVLKRSSLTAQTLLSANAARELADPMVGVDPVDAVATSTPPPIVVPAPVAAPALANTPAPVATPTPVAAKPTPDAAAKAAADKAAKERRELVGKLNALPRPIQRHKMPTCDKNSQAYKNAAIVLKKKVVAGQIAQAEKAGIRLTNQQKADALALKPNAVIVAGEPGFPLGSRCNPRPQAAPAKAPERQMQTRGGPRPHPLSFLGL